MFGWVCERVSKAYHDVLLVRLASKFDQEIPYCSSVIDSAPQVDESRLCMLDE